jgi:MinD superfamily P-loop ATPase
MREVVVLSGKGGTGKTTLLASFFALSERAVAADCDVDAPNLELLLDPRTTRREEFTGSRIAELDREACNGCGLCASKCRPEAITMLDDNLASLDGDRCEGCGVCVRICPEGAFDMVDRRVGEWYRSETMHGTLIHALLEPGGENSGKLVAMVKHQAHVCAEEEGADLLLVDGPPGIGCAAISAMSGADLVVLVAEPTKSGIADLRRISELGTGLGQRMALVINRSDINSGIAEQMVVEMAEAGIPLAGTVPYDDAAAFALAEGRTLAEVTDSPAAMAVRRLWSHLANSLN